MRRALLIGIDDYNFAPLNGCVTDAEKIQKSLSWHDNMAKNFNCELLLSKQQQITENVLNKAIWKFFQQEMDVAFLYFSGHGGMNDLGGFLMTQDATQYDMGVSLDMVIQQANKAKAEEVVLVLDCCHSGLAGNPTIFNGGNSVLLRKGVSILTSSSSNQFSYQKKGESTFTKLLGDALAGGAADIQGKVNIGAIYNYIEQLLRTTTQRPIFKSYLSQMLVLKQCKPRIELETLHQLPVFFKKKTDELPLSPEYEYSVKPRNHEKEAIFRKLQKLTALGLIEPIDEEHMFFAAINYKACRLTPLGQYYWQLIVNQII